MFYLNGSFFDTKMTRTTPHWPRFKVSTQLRDRTLVVCPWYIQCLFRHSDRQRAGQTFPQPRPSLRNDGVVYTLNIRAAGAHWWSTVPTRSSLVPERSRAMSLLSRSLMARWWMLR